MKNNKADIRKDYIFNESNDLKESNVSSDPLEQFMQWFEEALKTDPNEANAMFLATSSKDGKPSVRTVLLKGIDNKGFVFFTNYSSRKGNELNENPNASILFFWKVIERQIRIEGITERVTRDESEEYFHKRPFESQIAALASAQSSVIKSRKTLENKYNELKEKYTGNTVPLPKTWGGYRLIPDKMEFWQGRQNRMHDRILYSKVNGNWKIQRLSP
ncbi:MAG: pyridoxamine 5'-phosphate oxidase [Bacteroidota bacterium]|nr:pyridoxamine 5'-phosphate oxidase [Bacteroidota bacterium]